jgi:hypothetical protein
MHTRERDTPPAVNPPAHRPGSGRPRKGWSHAQDRWRSARQIIGRNRVFLVLLVLAGVPRALAMAAYRPVLFESDSIRYLQVANDPGPDLMRTIGYPGFLWLLKPFHELALVAVVQHLLGLATAVLMYVILRRCRLPRWGAALATTPVLFDGRQIWLEHAVLSEAVFTCCAVSAVAVVLWRPALPVRTAAGFGLLFGVAILVRPVALALLALVGGHLLIRRTHPRAMVAVLLGCLLPLGASAAWFHAHHGRYLLTSGDGIFLWGRTMSFADCARMKPPPDLVDLCPDRGESRRWHGSEFLGDDWPWNFLTDSRLAGDYVWDRRGWVLTGPGPVFGLDDNDRARRFAVRAITSQPLDYALVVGRDVAVTVATLRHPATAAMRHGTRTPDSLDSSVQQETREYAQGHAHAHRVRPYDPAMDVFTDRVYLHSALYVIVMITGLAGVIARRREQGGPGLLPWSMAVGLLVLPCATAQPELRYAIPSIPFACLAAALAFGPKAATQRTLIVQ